MLRTFTLSFDQPPLKQNQLQLHSIPTPSTSASAHERAHHNTAKRRHIQMAITSRLCLTLAIALAVVSTFSHNVYALAAEAAPVPPTADVADDNFNYEQYQSPPIWSRMFILFSTSRQTPPLS